MSFYGSIVLWCIYRNIPPAHFEKYLRMTDEERSRLQHTNDASPDEVARRALNACAQYAVAEQLAKEWSLLDSEIRMKFTNMANAGWRSGNKTKGLLRLDKMLGGKILRREYIEGPTAYEEFHRVRRADLSAIGLNFIRLPADYASWPPERKKKFRQQLARERREGRG